MLLQEEKKIEKIEIYGDLKFIQVKEVSCIKKGDRVVGTMEPKHYIITPNSDIGGESEEIQALCNLIHTSEVKKLYKQSKDKFIEYYKMKTVIDAT